MAWNSCASESLVPTGSSSASSGCSVRSSPPERESGSTDRASISKSIMPEFRPPAGAIGAAAVRTGALGAAESGRSSEGGEKSMSKSRSTGTAAVGTSAAGAATGAGRTGAAAAGALGVRAGAAAGARTGASSRSRFRSSGMPELAAPFLSISCAVWGSVSAPNEGRTGTGAVRATGAPPGL